MGESITFNCHIIDICEDGSHVEWIIDEIFDGDPNRYKTLPNHTHIFNIFSSYIMTFPFVTTQYIYNYEVISLDSFVDVGMSACIVLKIAKMI